ncbi:MAG TPA: glycosyltransferase [Acidimicrobiales bacterium]
MTGRRVRVVVVNYNGGDTTRACIDSVLASDWPEADLDLVLVDNASHDGVAAAVKADVPRVTVIEAGSNRGFAGGCNLALHDLSEVDFVALLNNDATVEPGWLGPLVAAMDAGPAIGAANPKILFTGSFVDIALESSTAVRGLGDRRPLGFRLSGAQLDGADAFGRVQLVEGFWGLEHGHDGETEFQWSRGLARIRVPVRDDGGLPSVRLRLASDSKRTVVVRSGSKRAQLAVTADATWFDVPVDGQPFPVVNNVGGVLLADGYGADRGYQEPDEGQFDRREEIFAWCGAAVLLSVAYLRAVGLFEERFFLYYEDTDLSWRGRSQGWRYVYVPESVVHHVHSASSVEGSRLFAHFVERNRLLMLTRNAPLALAGKEAGRHLLITGSYARRDILSPLFHLRRPAVETVRRRLQSLGAYVRLLPRALNDRRALRRRRTVDDGQLLDEWVGRR